jgi:hypothetical protein
MTPLHVRLFRARVRLALYGSGATIWTYDAIRLANVLHS